MDNYRKYELGTDAYKVVVANQIINNSDMLEVKVGARTKLYKLGASSKLLCVNKVTNTLNIGSLNGKQFSSFLATFKTNLLKNILEKNLLDLKVDFSGLSKQHNKDLWTKTPVGQYFFCIDFKSAYWQIANKLGYIDDKLFASYMDLESYKQAKRLCISFLARPISANYHKRGYSIKCDTGAFCSVYDNIRSCLYNYVAGMVKVAKNEYFMYNTDAIYIMPEKVDAIKQYLFENNITFKTTLCKKISETQFTEGCKIKNF